MSSNYFAELSAVDVSRHIEQKGGYSYLSWPYAISELLTRHPAATWRVVEADFGIPYFITPAGAFVKVAVTVDGIERVQIHPVLDGSNRTVEQPNAFQINTSLQRCLVKAIALHGLGLSLYAGEDLTVALPPPGPPILTLEELILSARMAVSQEELRRVWTEAGRANALDRQITDYRTGETFVLRERLSTLALDMTTCAADSIDTEQETLL